MPKNIVAAAVAVCWKVNNCALSFTMYYVTKKTENKIKNFYNHSPPMKKIINNTN